MVVIIDYGMGNLHSVQKAVTYCKKDVCISNDPKIINTASHIILPGVGAFKDGMKNLRALGLYDVLTQEVLINKKPFLGICLGMQLICTKSFEYGETEGLGWINAEVRRFDSDTLKIPHVGWNEVHTKDENILFQKIPKASDFYFVHSFYVTDNAFTSATTPYQYDFCSSLHKDNIYACQFHPEKSQIVGLQLLENFLNIQEAKNA